MKYLRQEHGFYKGAIALMVPIIIQNIVTNFMSLADTFMVGALGETELAAVTMANSGVRTKTWTRKGEVVVRVFL